MFVFLDTHSFHACFLFMNTTRMGKGYCAYLCTVMKCIQIYLLKNLFQDRTKVNIVNVDFVIKFFNK